jgi:hypothetical protein
MVTIAVMGSLEAHSKPAQVTGEVRVFLFDAKKNNVDRMVVIDGGESRRHTGKGFELSQGSHRITLSGAQDYDPKFKDLEIVSDSQKEVVVFSLVARSLSERTDTVPPSGFVRSVHPST